MESRVEAPALGLGSSRGAQKGRVPTISFGETHRLQGLVASPHPSITRRVRISCVTCCRRWFCLFGIAGIVK